MANGIDPLTGLPSDLFDSVVNQIPLGTGIFPWEDLEATSRPVRPPLYGDDILPTNALLAGQHQTTKNAQTVYTDGKHRLLVAGDGGGPSLLPFHWKSIQSETLSVGNNALVFFNTGLTADNALVYVYLSWSCDPTQQQPPFGPDVFMFLHGEHSPASDMNILDDFAVEGDPATLMPAQRGRVEAVFPSPMLLSTYFQPGDRIEVEVASSFVGHYSAGVAWI